jgi:alkanesulfonate monooxygenase SsuD/methylene tetrahydromethanopterin reductase-like flavin-dependent oxidoreductase (luciferase family)
MRLGILAGLDDDWKDSLEKVKIAEQLGYEMAGRGEAWGTSVLPWLTLLAANTTTIKLGPTILNCFSRSPAAMAQEIGLLDSISGGRMVMGFGSSGNQVIEGYHGVPFEKPVRRLREYTEIFNILISGEPLNYEGEIFHLDRGFRLEYDRPRTNIPVYIAAITPKSIVQTGEIADGIYPIHWPKGQFNNLRAQLDAASTGAGRNAGSVTIAPFTNVYILDGQNDELQWQAARGPLHHYVNRMGSFYWQMLSRGGFEAEVGASRAAWAERDKQGSIAAITEEMVREIQVIGPIESVREQLQERSTLGAEMQMVNMPPGDTATVGAYLESLLR